MVKPKKKKKEVNELTKSIVDDIIAETEELNKDTTHPRQRLVVRKDTKPQSTASCK